MSKRKPSKKNEKIDKAVEEVKAHKKQVSVSPEDAKRLTLALVQRNMECQKCHHEKILDAIKSNILGLYLKADEIAEYDVKKGVLTITKQKEGK